MEMGMRRGGLVVLLVCMNMGLLLHGLRLWSFTLIFGAVSLCPMALTIPHRFNPWPQSFSCHC